MVTANGASLVNILLVGLFIQSLTLLCNLYEFLIMTYYLFFLSPPPVLSVCFFPARFLIICKLLNIFPFNSNPFFSSQASLLLFLLFPVS